MRLLALLAVSSVALAAAPKTPGADTAQKTPTVAASAQAVAALIAQQARAVMVDTSNSETAWTDSAVLERNSSFPRAIAALIESPSPNRQLEAGKVAALIDSFQQHREGFGEGKVERTGPSCFVVRGTVRALVNCVYVDYLQARYPGASFLVHGAFEPVLLLERDRVRAMLMPMKP